LLREVDLGQDGSAVAGLDIPRAHSARAASEKEEGQERGDRATHRRQTPRHAICVVGNEHGTHRTSSYYNINAKHLGGARASASRAMRLGTRSWVGCVAGPSRVRKGRKTTTAEALRVGAWLDIRADG